MGLDLEDICVRTKTRQTESGKGSRLLNFTLYSFVFIYQIMLYRDVNESSQKL